MAPTHPVNRQDLLAAFKWPTEIESLVSPTDGMCDFDVLWSLAYIRQPRWIVELGTRSGISTRVLRNACPKANLLTVDVDDCSHHLKGVDCTFWHMPAEQALEKYLWETDLLFIDTSPHSYEQTKVWMETWVAKKLRCGGIACFHDTISYKGVIGAIQEWTASNPGWIFTEFGAGFGLGVLQCPLEPR